MDAGDEVGVCRGENSDPRRKMKMISVAIDGPAGAGKSTISRAVAQKLGFIYVDTGALYRTVAVYLIENGADLGNADEIGKLLASASVDLKFVDGEQRMILNGRDVTDFIRTPEVSMAASKVSALACVRSFLLECQRSLARRNNVIMDGRDIGTVVLPDAAIKIFLTADPKARARRRYDEMIAKGMPADYDAVLADIIKRDHDDSTRAIAPLRPSEDAIMIDTTEIDLEQSIDLIYKTVTERL